MSEANPNPEANPGNAAGASTAPAPAPTPTTPPPAPATPPATEPEKKYTDADLDRLQAKRAAEARKAAEKQLIEQLGGKTPAEVKAILDAHQAAEDAKKDELTRAQEALAAAQRQAEQAQAETARLAREQLIDRKLVAAGVGSGHPADKRESVLTRARAALQLAADADAEAIDAEIAATVELIPGLIAPQGPANDGRPTAPSGVTSGATPPPGGQPAQSLLEKGAAAARARLQQTDPNRDPFARLTGRS